jgi:glycerol-3-phosphate O-acyltransferase
MTARNCSSRVATVDESEVLRDERFRGALRALAKEQGRDFTEVEHYARECLGELAVRPADRYLGWIARLARFMYTRSFDSEFDVNSEALEELKELAKTRPVVFLWSHKSHLDGFVLTRTLYDADFRPHPLTFAGLNMNFLGFGAVAKHAGAIFLRRSFKDDDVYKLVLKYFIDYLASRRVPLSWSIEGTRSRTGRLLPPKLGLIHWVVEAYKRASIDDAVFVPVAISFDQIPEMDDYIAMQHGVPKRRESLRWFIDYVAGMKANYGKVYVRFAEPIALSESAPVAAAPAEVEKTDAPIQKLALEICNRIEHVIPITMTDLVTLVLLAANGRALDAGQIWRQAQDIVELIEERGLPTAGDSRARSFYELQRKLQTLTETRLLQCYAGGATPVYVIRPGRLLAAAYYRNTIVQYFLSSALAEVALATARNSSSGGSFDTALMQLRDLLKFEFPFKPKDAFHSDALEFLGHRYPGWRSDGGVFPPAPQPLFGQGILRSFIEAYWILARLLVSRGWRGVSRDSESALIEACLARGEELLMRREISTEAALSKPLFETALRLARHRQLLDGDSETLTQGRQAFAAELDRVLAAINCLQAAYDQHLGDQNLDTPYEHRSVA